jgi:GTP cyclohydrolase I
MLTSGGSAGVSKPDNLESICRLLLYELGEDPDREGLKDTPRRWAKMWREFIDYDPGTLDTMFESQGNGQMIVVSGLRVWSMCEHHLLPFWCDISIGYIPNNGILGLSKFGRIAQKFAHQLQVQERLVREIAAYVVDVAQTSDVAVLARGEHLCMTMRGAKMPAQMTTTEFRGAFNANSVRLLSSTPSDQALRQEFLSLARHA